MVILLFLGILTTANGQYKIPFQEDDEDKDRIIIYFNSGPSIPLAPSNFPLAWRTAFNLGIGVGKALNKKTIFMFYFDYNRFPTDEFLFLEAFGLQNSHTLTGGEITISTFTANFKRHIFSEIMKGGFFLIGGVGALIRSDADARAISPGSTVTFDGTRSNAFNVSLGPGLDIPIGDNHYLFFELRYSIGFTDPQTTYMPIKIGYMW